MGDIIETSSLPARNPGHRAPRFAKCKPMDRYRT